MKKQKIGPPQLGELNPQDFFLDDEALYQDGFLKDSDQSYTTCHNLIIQESQLKNIQLVNSRLERFQAANVIFDKCDLSNCELLGASLHQVEFRQCKLTGANFAESYLRDCRFVDCLADYASFSNSNLKNVAFNDCRLKETDFYDLTWKALELNGCELTRSNWLHTTLNKLNLSSCDFETISISPEQLRGLVVNPAQALIIAAGLGLVIE